MLKSTIVLIRDTLIHLYHFYFIVNANRPPYQSYKILPILNYNYMIRILLKSIIGYSPYANNRIIIFNKPNNYKYFERIDTNVFFNGSLIEFKYE